VARSASAASATWRSTTSARRPARRVSAGDRIGYTVTISNTGFTPDTVSSAVGDTVTWTSTDGVHAISFIAALSPDSLASSGPIAMGQAKFTIFLKAGTYTYLDDSVKADTGVVQVH